VGVNQTRCRRSARSWYNRCGAHETRCVVASGRAADDRRTGEHKGGAVPVYEYRCQECGKRFEVNAHLAERDQLAVCPKCHGKKVEVVISSFTCVASRKY
jgi:putative FmdB family regulatory protein